jgi:hypothetical protein
MAVATSNQKLTSERFMLFLPPFARLEQLSPARPPATIALSLSLWI